MTKEYAQEIFALLKKHYPNAKMILQWSNNFELLTAIILSAQCTDKKVNGVTSKLFPKYKIERPEFALHYRKYTRMPLPKPIRLTSFAQGKDLRNNELIQLVNIANAPIQELEQDIRSTGFYHNKAKNLQAAATTILEKFGGILPKTIEELTTIPGVGRKTANVFLGNAYGISEGIAVDAHVTKQSKLLGLTENSSPEKIERDLMQLFPKDQWFTLTYLLIEHGRNKRKKKIDQITCKDPKCLLCIM